MSNWIDSAAGLAFMPHGHCYLWQPVLLWTHVGADTVTALAYFSIPAALVYFTHKRKDTDFNWIFLMFAGFILFCGLTHVTEAVTTWEPIYYTQGVIKVATAAISAFTAVAVWYLMPRALAVPSADELHEANQRLKRENRERRRAEEAVREANQHLEERVRERTEELSQFVYAVSHDLQEPLRHLRTYSEFLREDLDTDMPPRAQQDLEYIEQAGIRLRNMVDGMQALSHVGRQDMVRTEFDVADCITEALENTGIRLEETGAHIGDPPSCAINADRRMVTTVYQNLISNALKYSDGTPSIEFTAEQSDGHTVLGVRDRGVGVEPAYRRRILQPFTRLHGVAKGGGSGIGLSICRRVVERHGGSIWVEDNDGEPGSHFRFTLDDRSDH
ncbi:MAG: ATP-binding protein [Halofilum sp. (in: g-proteobacteria)]|nr:ATP-binding protein [Halofilum sp. (in: g-proteobacteria)]